MRIFTFCFCLVYVISRTTTCVFAKSLYDNNFQERNNDELKQYPIKRRGANQEQPYFPDAPEEEPYPEPFFANSDNQPLQRSRRVENKQQPLIEKQLDLKRSTLVGADKLADRLNKRDLNLRPQRRDEAYGIVYGNGRPIGILEPFPQAYEFAPFFNSREGVEEIEPIIPPPRRSAVDVLYPFENRIGGNALENDWSENGEASLQDSAKYTDDNYPAVLNDFKIDAKLSNANNAFPRGTKDVKRDRMPEKRELKSSSKSKPMKRSPIGITNEKIAELKSALNKIQNPGSSNRVNEIEDNLHDILFDMGLVDDGDEKDIDTLKNKREIKSTYEEDKMKREADKEDENLEEGLNRIEITKANHGLSKRESRIENKESKVDKTRGVDALDSSPLKLKDDDEASENANAESNASSLKSVSQEDGINSEENQNHVDVKRSTSKLAASNYQNEGEAYIRSKRQETKNENNDLMKGLEKSGDLTVSGNKSPLASSGNEGELEKKSSKDQTTFSPSALEKVKREQDELEYQKRIEQNIQSKIDAIKEQVKREIEALKAKGLATNKQETQRQKREAVNTLIEEENSALDPPQHPEEKLLPYVRRRRNSEENLKPLKRIKRSLPDFANLENIDSGDYLDLTDQRRIQSDRDSANDYQFDRRENGFESNEGLQNSKNSDAESVKEKRDTNAQNADTKIEESAVSNAPVEKKDVLVETVESEEQLKNKENPNEMKQKRSAEKNNNQKDLDLFRKDDFDHPEKKDVEAEEMEQKENSQNSEDGLNKKHSRSKSSDSTELDLDTNLEVKLKSEQNTEEPSIKNRKRRQVEEENAQYQLDMYRRRNKRANAVMPYAKSAFFPYRADDDEGDDEGDEFDEDSFEDRSVLQKRDVYSPRQLRRSPDYQRLPDYDYYSSNTNYQPEKRSLANKYVASLNPDVYENPNNYLYNPSTYVRRKRQSSIEQLASLHSGGPTLHHLAAIRDRNTQNINEDGLRSKRNFHKNEQNSGGQKIKEEPENIADLSDTDLFGALPQSYDGNNLLRFKRVKREVAKLNKASENSSIEKQGAG